jgi:mycothiol system anti-sigma-R factor
MNCTEFEASLHPYVDGELSVDGMAAADSHAAECRGCAALARRERDFRDLVRRQPRETAPPELRAKILARVRREQRHRAWRPWLVASGLAAAMAVLVVVAVLPALRPAAPLLGELVDKHIAFAQIERPMELATSDRGEIEAWFRQRAGLRVTVPDYSPAGIHLMGARLADARERKAAYLLYEKGRTLLSVFAVPVSGHEGEVSGASTAFRGQRYLTKEIKGFRTVSWSEGGVVFGLVSTLDYQALLECADRLRLEREQQNRL